MQRRLKRLISRVISNNARHEAQLLALGKLLSAQLRQKEIKSLADCEFSIFSQWGDDGIIQWLTHQVEFNQRTFVEFGVENYRESNTRFLMMNNNWAGMVLDSEQGHIRDIQESEYFWRFQLTAHNAFVDCSNINEILTESGINVDLGILHIDIDGNDYWVWKSIECCHPVVVIMEYNAVFGEQRAITIPYEKTFRRNVAHYSNLYFGASLPALRHLGKEKGYTFLGCNSAGNNAYFVRNDKVTPEIVNVAARAEFVSSKFREGRLRNGQLSHVGEADRIKEITGLRVFNVLDNCMEDL